MEKVSVAGEGGSSEEGEFNKHDHQQKGGDVFSEVRPVFEEARR